MPDEVRTGARVLEEFFAGVAQIPEVDADTARALSELHASRTFTKDAILSKLGELRHQQIRGGDLDADAHQD